tara:strand:+ start:2227 stop:3054 length:828 start_codon:yes stop_codon:yes gene_type:complete
MPIKIVPKSDASRRKDTISKVKGTAADERRLKRIKSKREKEAKELAAARRQWRQAEKKAARHRLRTRPSADDLTYERRMEAGKVEGVDPEEVGADSGNSPYNYTTADGYPIKRSKGSTKKGETKKKKKISPERLREIMEGKTEPARSGADRTTPLQKRGGGPVYRRRGSSGKGEKKKPEPTANTHPGMSTPSIMISIVSPNARLGAGAKARKVFSGGKTAAERRTDKLQSAALSKVMKKAHGGAVVAARHNRASSGSVSRGAGIAVKGIKFKGVR